MSRTIGRKGSFMGRRLTLFWILASLVLPLAVGCGSEEKKAPIAASVAATPSGPPIDEDTARRFVERFVMAMNAKDNLQLFRMVKPGGTFLVETMAGSQQMDSAAFLKWFQTALRSAKSLSFEVTAMRYEGMPRGAVVTVDLKEEVGSGRNRASGKSQARFVLELDDEDRIQCSRMDGGEQAR